MNERKFTERVDIMYKKLKAVIYCRVANENQLEVDNQKKILELYCEMKGYELYKVYIDNGYSANSFRPAYDSMLRELKQEKFRIVIACNVDRLNRNLGKLLSFMNFLNDNSCRLETLDYSTNNISTILNKIRIIKKTGMYLRFSTEEKAKLFFGFKSRGVNNV